LHTSCYLVLARTIVVLGGACSLARPHQPCFWCGRHRVPREQGPRQFGRKLDSEDGGEHRERLAGRHVGDPLARGEGPWLSTELPDRELGPCEGFLARGSNEDLGEACALLDTSVKIPESSTGVCISIALYLPHLHCFLGCCKHLGPQGMFR